MGFLYRLLRNLIALPFLPLWWLVHRLTRPRGNVLVVSLHRSLVEIEPDRPWPVELARSARGEARSTSLTKLRKLVDRVIADPGVGTVVVKIPALRAGWAACCGLRRVVIALREAGKTVVVYLHEGGGNRELFVATAASKVVLSPQATFGPLGVAATLRYVRPLLERVGLKVEVEARAEYKTAAEPALRDEPSDAQREQLTALLKTVDGALRDAIAERGADPAAVFERGIVRGQDAVDLGLADEVCYEDELLARVTGRPDAESKAIRAARYLSWHEARPLLPLRARPYIAVVTVHGAIVTGPVRSMPGRTVAEQDQLVGALRAVGRDRRAAGVVLHVDSPGGSALASDLIHREVQALGAKKPVVACFGEVAASGGYYVAAPAAHIVAQPLTITGSIGVVMAKLMAMELAERVGIRMHTLRLAPHADLLNVTRPLSEAERAILSREADGFYKAFVDVVAAGRGRSYDDVEPLARGRVWSGDDARQRGLVDEVGGLDVAVAAVRSRLTALSEKARAALEPSAVRGPRGRLPLPLPSPEPASRLVGRLAPEALTLLDLTISGELALYYAPGLPMIE